MCGNLFTIIKEQAPDDHAWQDSEMVVSAYSNFFDFISVKRTTVGPAKCW